MFSDQEKEKDSLESKQSKVQSTSWVFRISIAGTALKAILSKLTQLKNLKYRK